MNFQVKSFQKSVAERLEVFESRINDWFSQNKLGDPVIIRSNTPDDVLTVLIFYTIKD